jgi:DNA-binding GntR family transcriptional regulator
MLDWVSRFKRDLVLVRGAERITLDEHERIYKAVAAGDPDGAAAAMTDHLSRASALYAVLDAESAQSRRHK